MKKYICETLCLLDNQHTTSKTEDGDIWNMRFENSKKEIWKSHSWNARKEIDYLEKELKHLETDLKNYQTSQKYLDCKQKLD